MPSASRTAYEIGLAYEQTLGDHERRQGAHFTPPDVAEALVARAWAYLGRYSRPRAPVVCDPSCGGGAFLVAAAQQLLAEGHDPASIVEHHIVGVDLDAGAVAASTAALCEWASSAGATRRVTPRILHRDGLSDWHHGLDRIDLVIGNPPFQNQLGSSTARDVQQRRLLAERFGEAAKGYVDVAALFLVHSLAVVRPGGVVCLIQPRSLLAARDTAAVRSVVFTGHRLEAMWVPGTQIFDALVDVCAPIVVAGAGAGAGAVAGSGSGTGTGTGAHAEQPPKLHSVAVLGGRLAEIDIASVAASDLAVATTWSPLWAAANGVPTVNVDPATPTIATIATATAGFRDQFYGVLPHLRAERPDRGAKVISTGMVDPLDSSWATRRSRIGGSAWTAPWVDLDAVAHADAELAAWIDRMLVPKVLVSTQTKVIEAIADPDGEMVPLTPVIAVIPKDNTATHHLVAALSAPAATAWAAARFGGAGMSHAALKLAARQVLEIPVPSDAQAWDHAARLTQRGAPIDEPGWTTLAKVMNSAWGIDDDELATWWVHRLPQMSSRHRAVR